MSEPMTKRFGIAAHAEATVPSVEGWMEFRARYITLSKKDDRQFGLVELLSKI